jgi:hypothetical protein
MRLLKQIWWVRICGFTALPLRADQEDERGCLGGRTGAVHADVLAARLWCKQGRTHFGGVLGRGWSSLWRALRSNRRFEMVQQNDLEDGRAPKPNRPLFCGRFEGLGQVFWVGERWLVLSGFGVLALVGTWGLLALVSCGPSAIVEPNIAGWNLRIHSSSPAGASGGRTGTIAGSNWCGKMTRKAACYKSQTAHCLVGGSEAWVRFLGWCALVGAF